MTNCPCNTIVHAAIVGKEFLIFLTAKPYPFSAMDATDVLNWLTVVSATLSKGILACCSICLLQNLDVMKLSEFASCIRSVHSDSSYWCSSTPELYAVCPLPTNWREFHCRVVEMCWPSCGWNVTRRLPVRVRRQIQQVAEHTTLTSGAMTAFGLSNVSFGFCRNL